MMLNNSFAFNLNSHNQRIDDFPISDMREQHRDWSPNMQTSEALQNALPAINSEPIEPYIRKHRSSTSRCSNNSSARLNDDDETQCLRIKINSRERKRMHDLNGALEQLRSVMPGTSGPNVRKTSKIGTLLLARDHILQLQADIDQLKTALGQQKPSVTSPISTTAQSPTSKSPMSSTCSPHTKPAPCNSSFHSIDGLLQQSQTATPIVKSESSSTPSPVDKLTEPILKKPKLNAPKLNPVKQCGGVTLLNGRPAMPNTQSNLAPCMRQLLGAHMPCNCAQCNVALAWAAYMQQQQMIKQQFMHAAKK